MLAAEIPNGILPSPKNHYDSFSRLSRLDKIEAMISIRDEQHSILSGLDVGERRVGRLMRVNGIKPVRTRKHKVMTNSNHSLGIVDNVLDGDFTADAPNRKWAKQVKVPTMSSIGGKRSGAGIGADFEQKPSQEIRNFHRRIVDCPVCGNRKIFFASPSIRFTETPLMSSTYLLIASTLSAFITFLLCLRAREISLALGIMDTPDERKHHRVATPLMGGVALQLGFIPVALALVYFYIPIELRSSLLLCLACIAAVTMVGLADDRHTLSARNRLFITFAVFGVAALVDPLFNVRALNFELFDLKFGLGTGWIAAIFTVVCCVGLLNAVNMADGKNGLVIGLCLGWTTLLAIRAPAPLLPMLALLASMLVVLMLFNLRGRLFLGDGGAYGIATAIGMLAIAIYNTPGSHAGRSISADELMLLFCVPVIDSFRLTFVRMRRGQSPMAADRDHLHHHLQNWFGWPRGLIVYLLLALLPGAILFAR